MIQVFKNQKGKFEVMKTYDQLLTLWGTELTETDIKTSFGTTHCIISGNTSSPPLLLLHGVGDNSAVMWALNIQDLSKHFYCIAIDTLGGPGKSIPNDHFIKNTFTQRKWLNEILDHFQIDKTNIAGVSNGAVMAYNYAVKEKDRVHKVVCLEGGMVINPWKAMISTIGMLFPEILLPTHKNMKAIMKKLISPNSQLFEKNPLIIDHLVLLMKHHNRKAMFVHTIDEYKREEGIAIKDNLYFLLGDHHVEKKSDYIAILEDGGYPYKIINNAGHAVNHEQPKVVNEEIIRFLNACVN